MIILERLEIVRFKGVRGVALDLPERGSVLIEGRNEAGKSSLFEAIHFGLYGRTLAGTLADAIPYDGDLAEVGLRLRIDRPGAPPDFLDITRAITAGKQGPVATVRLRVERGGAEVEEVRRVADATRRIAQELGGLTAETLVNSCFVAQKQVAGLETLDRSHREAAVAALLNLDRLTRAASSFAARPTDLDELRRHEARVVLADATAQLGEMASRRDQVDAVLRRLDLRDALDAFEEAAAREVASIIAGRDAAGDVARAGAILGAVAAASGAARAWEAVATGAHAFDDATITALASGARHATAVAAREALPEATNHLEALGAIDAAITATASWLGEGRRALVEEVRVIKARRDGRARMAGDLVEATDRLGEVDAEAASLQAHRDSLRPGLALRDRARERRRFLDDLREAVAVRAARARDCVEARAQVEARADVDRRLVAAQAREVSAAERFAVHDRLRASAAERVHVAAVRVALADAIAARDAVTLARTRNERLRNLVLGVLDADPDGDGNVLHLRLLVSHEATGARVIDLSLARGQDLVAKDREATDAERARVDAGEVPALAPADLTALEAEASRARDALSPLGEAPPATARAARARLADLDAALSVPVPNFDVEAYDRARDDRDQAVAEARLRALDASALPEAVVVARREATAMQAFAARSEFVSRQAEALGLVLPDDADGAAGVVDEARREVDATLEATAEVAGALASTELVASSLQVRRGPLEARVAVARADLERDDDESLDRAEAAARETGRAGDAACVDAWRIAVAGARSRGLEVAKAPEAGLPDRESVAVLAGAVRGRADAARAEASRLRAVAAGEATALADFRRDTSREGRAKDDLDAAIRAAGEAVARVAPVSMTLPVGHADNVARAIALAATIRAPSVVDGSGHPSFGDGPAPDGGLSAHPVAGTINDLGTRAGTVATAFDAVARAVDVAAAHGASEDASAAERIADRSRAMANADGETAWRAAADAATALGVAIGPRPGIDEDDRPAGVDVVTAAVAAARAVVAGDATLPGRDAAVAMREAILGEAGAASEAMAAARRVVGDEEALPVDDARGRLETARRDRRARDRAATILIATRARMMAAILPDTQREMGRLLPDLTAGRYRFPRLDDRFQLEVFDERKRGWVRRSLFSGGTQDQFSLALRLGFAIAALPREVGTAPGFLFLDEPLSSFDRERTRALVDLLRDPAGIIGSHFRQVFLISHSQAFDPGLFAYQVEMEDGRVSRSTLPARAVAAIPSVVTAGE